MAHPIYEKLKAERDASGRMPYLDTKDAAKCLRTTLAKKFPGVKFSVKISRYSGGSSIRVSWIDGPTAKQVEAYANAFEGKGFDGMIDMSYYKDIYLMPDGSAAFAQTGGTEGSMGVHPAAKVWKPEPDAILVSPSCYVFCERSTSLKFMRNTLESYARKYSGCPLAKAIEAGEVGVRESKWGGWEYFGEPHMIRDAVGPGAGYGGDTALYQHASRRAAA